MQLSAIFLLSLASLSYEVLIARIFSISQWHHLSFMVISVALFGFAASGTALSILDAFNKAPVKRFSTDHATAWMIRLYALSGTAALILLPCLPLDYFRLPLEPIQGLYLLTAYLLLSMPFFFTGLLISVSYSATPEKTGTVYFATMLGSACGAAVPFLLLPFFGEGKLAMASVFGPAILILPAEIKAALYRRNSPHRRIAVRAVPLVISIGAAIVLFLTASNILEPIPVEPSPYKALSQICRLPDTHISETTHTIRGRIDRVESPYIRFVPGLSLKFTDRLPRQWALFRDGDGQLTFYEAASSKQTAFPRYTLPYLGYFLARTPDRVLIVQNGGGSAVPCAVSSGARHITILEQNPKIAEMMRGQACLFNIVNEHPRTFFARTDEKFDVIHIDSWGASMAGADALTQDFLFTKEAFAAYMGHLARCSHLIISRRLHLPPADSLRLFATAYEVLRTGGLFQPERHLALLRSWDTFTLVVSSAPVDTTRVKEFAKELNFDLVFLHDMTTNEANRFNVFDEPFHFIKIRNLAAGYGSGTQDVFFNRYLLDVKPLEDDRPFFGRYLKWTRIKDLYQITGKRLYGMLLSGEVVVGVVFVETLLITLLLLILPLAATYRRESRPSFSQVVYFFSIGAGFMFVELYYLKAFTLLFGDPIISLTVVLSAFLVFSGAGGMASRNLGSAAIRPALIGIVALMGLSVVGMEPVLHRLLSAPTVMRFIFATLLMLPAGVAIGFPFPLGMRCLLSTPAERAYAWTSNGCASVLASVAAAQIAVSFGISTLAVSAAGAYIIALACRQNSATRPG